MCDSRHVAPRVGNITLAARPGRGEYPRCCECDAFCPTPATSARHAFAHGTRLAQHEACSMKLADEVRATVDAFPPLTSTSLRPLLSAEGAPRSFSRCDITTLATRVHTAARCYSCGKCARFERAKGTGLTAFARDAWSAPCPPPSRAVARVHTSPYSHSTGTRPRRASRSRSSRHTPSAPAVLSV
jgi:hypothetical protein